MSKTPVYVVCQMVDDMGIHTMKGVFSFEELAQVYADELTIKSFRVRFKSIYDWGLRSDLIHRMKEYNIPIYKIIEMYDDETLLKIIKLAERENHTIIEVEFFA